MRRSVPQCHIVCSPAKLPAKKIHVPPPPPSPPPPGCKVVQNRIDMCCPNVIAFPKTMKVPIVLAELDLQICIDVDITLEQPALEIKRVTKDVFLDECKLVATSFRNHFKLFISGYIRKTIEYASARPVNINVNAVCGSMLHTTAHIPFNCCTEVSLEGENFPGFVESSDTEARFLDKNNRGPKIVEKSFNHLVHYNEQPYCELEAFEINEFDFAKSNTSTPLPHFSHERVFTTVQEQIVLDLLVKVLQNQQIPIPCKHEHEEKSCNHEHEKKSCMRHEKKCEYDHDHEKNCCDHDHEKNCCDHSHEKKSCMKHEKKCEYDHDDEEECCDIRHARKSKKKCKIKCMYENEEKRKRELDHRIKTKYKKKRIGKTIKKYRKSRNDC